jgi:hypothetical protein
MTKGERRICGDGYFSWYLSVAYEAEWASASTVMREQRENFLTLSGIKL